MMWKRLGVSGSLAMSGRVVRMVVSRYPHVYACQLAEQRLSIVSSHQQAAAREPCCALISALHDDGFVWPIDSISKVPRGLGARLGVFRAGTAESGGSRHGVVLREAAPCATDAKRNDTANRLKPHYLQTDKECRVGGLYSTLRWHHPWRAIVSGIRPTATAQE